MAIFQDKPKRKATGGRYKIGSLKRNAQTGRRPALTRIDETKAKRIRTIGGNSKLKLMSSNKVNVLDPKTNKASVTDIKTILENPANRHFIRRNIMSKGAIIETPKGKARITNRPSQEGFVNAVLQK